MDLTITPDHPANHQPRCKSLAGPSTVVQRRAESESAQMLGLHQHPLKALGHGVKSQELEAYSSMP